MAVGGKNQTIKIKNEGTNKDINKDINVNINQKLLENNANKYDLSN